MPKTIISNNVKNLDGLAVFTLPSHYNLHTDKKQIVQHLLTP